jgi:hypothetical protein
MKLMVLLSRTDRWMQLQCDAKAPWQREEEEEEDSARRCSFLLLASLAYIIICMGWVAVHGCS